MAAEGVTIQYLLNLKEQLRERGFACKELDNFFATGAERMAREGDIKRLQNLTTLLKQHLVEVIQSEDSARCASLEADVVGSIGGLIVKGLGSAIAGPAWGEAFEKDQTVRRTRRQVTFGTIMICVGKGGLPDDVHIVSISKLARTQNRSESAIILEIQESGVLMFKPDEFWQLIEESIRDIRKGGERVPEPSEQLTIKQMPVKKSITKSQNSVKVIPIFPIVISQTPHDKHTDDIH